MAQDDIQGQVVDASGNPISGAIVELTRSYQSSPTTEGTVVRTTTDANGNYIFESHPDSDGTTLEYHVSCYNYDGTAYVNSENNPGVTAELSSPIPDSGELQARYDWREASGTTTVEDQSGNGNDLAGGYTGPTGDIGGVQAGTFDGTGDILTVSFSQSVSEPYHIFFLGKLESSNGTLWSDNPLPASGFVGLDEDSGQWEWKINGGSDQSLGGSDTNAHIFNILIDGANSSLRIDGVEVGTGDSQSTPLDGLAIGDRADELNPANVLYSEMLVYVNDRSSSESNIEGYLDRDTAFL